MKESQIESKASVFLSIVFILVMAGWSTAGTWYVDPVEGSDLYDGTSPFYIEGTMNGPKETIEAAAMMADEHDILILMDGTYSGEQNTGSVVFDTIDQKRLAVMSLAGPEDCILSLGSSILLGITPSEGQLPTCFEGLTFTGETVFSYDPVFRIENENNIEFTDCVFTNLVNDNHYFEGTFEISNASVLFSDCQFSFNVASYLIHCSNDLSQLTCRNCIFEYNEPNYDDNYPYFSYITAIDVTESAYALIDNCTIRNHFINNGILFGIDVYNNAQADIRDSVIENNRCYDVLFPYDSESYPTPVGILCRESIVNVDNTSIKGIEATISNSGDLWRGYGVKVSDPISLIVQNCTLTNNSVGVRVSNDHNNGYNTVSSSIMVLDTEISGYYSESPMSYGSSGISFSYDYSGLTFDIEIKDCHIHTHEHGIHGLYGLDLAFTSISIENCLVNDNAFGIDMYNDGVDSTLGLRNCTIVQNYSGISAYNATVSNCIVRDNDLGIEDQDNVTVNYCNVGGGWPEGTGNIDVDPLFADGGQYWYSHLDYIPGSDFHLKSQAGRYDPETMLRVYDDSDSPCIDAGDPADPVVYEPYGSGGRINMGAYGGTYQASLTDQCTGGIGHTGMIYGDINRDCHVNLADMAIIAANWLESTKVSGQ